MFNSLEVIVVSKMIYNSESEQDTLFLGELIGRKVESGQLLLLGGELGAGKTLLIKGLAQGLDIDTEITSPTYVLLNQYQGRLTLHHLDLYRLDQPSELYDIGLEEILGQEGVVAIEWPAIARDLFDTDYLEFTIKTVAEGKRKLQLKAQGAQSEKLLDEIKTELD